MMLLLAVALVPYCHGVALGPWYSFAAAVSPWFKLAGYWFC